MLSRIKIKLFVKWGNYAILNPLNNLNNYWCRYLRKVIYLSEFSNGDMFDLFIIIWVKTFFFDLNFFVKMVCTSRIEGWKFHEYFIMENLVVVNNYFHTSIFSCSIPSSIIFMKYYHDNIPKSTERFHHWTLFRPR